MTTADKLEFFRMAGEAKKAKAIGDSSFYGENLPQAQTGLPETGLPEMGMHTYGAPHLPSKKMERTYKQNWKKSQKEKAKEHRQIGRSDKQEAKGHHLRDKANLSKPGKAPSQYVNEKKAARINKRADKAFNKSMKIQDKYLWD